MFLTTDFILGLLSYPQGNPSENRSEKVGKEVYFWIDAGFVAQVMQSVLDYIRENL